MIGHTLGHYRILEKIGAGGMGEVYRAEDLHLARDVAIKVLPAGMLADEAARKRFRKEAEALSKLNHPNIQIVHDFDTQEGLDFLVVEFVPGPTLAEKLGAGALPEKEVASLGSQMAAALEEAHERGVVHRDLKPGNIKVTPKGQVKVLDFGLAKLLKPFTETATTESFTQTHQAAGTLPYMAPEQLRGERADARSDLWAAGAVLYEMAAGQRPFPETQGPRLIDSILHQAPTPPSALNRRLSPELQNIILKCLEKNPESRYQSAKELVVDLRRLSAPSPYAPSPQAPAWGRLMSRRWALALALVALPGLLAVLFAFDIGGLRARLVASPAPRIQSLAVLPLKNLMGDPEQDYFVEGMHEALITELSKISALKVISRTSAMRYKDTDKAMPQIARELKVEGLIEGSVLRGGDQVRITVQLVHGPTDRHLWAENYQREMRGILALQSEVARAIAREVEVKLTPQEQTRLASARPVNPEAYEAYLRGKFQFRIYDGTGERRTEAAIQSFERATALDPEFALAHAALAEAYISKFFSIDPNPEWEQKGSMHVERALSLDPNLAAAYKARGDLVWTLANHFPHERAIQDYRKALALKPSLAEAHFALGSVYMHIGLLEKSLDEFQAAVALDPNSPDARYRIPRIYLYQQRYQAVLAEFERSPDFPAAWQWQKVLALFYMGRKSEALVLAEELKRQLPRQEDITSTYAILLAATDRRQKAEQEIQIAIRSGQGRSHFHHAAYNIASAYSLMGKKRLASEWLERTAKEGLPCYPLFEKDPNLNPLRQDREFAAFLARVRSQWERFQASL